MSLKNVCVALSAFAQPTNSDNPIPFNRTAPEPESRNLLGPLFWNVVLQRNISDEQLKKMLRAYEQVLRNRGVGTRHRNLDGDIYNQLKRGDMTWKIFCMGLEAIGAELIDVQLGVSFKEAVNVG